MSTTTYLVVSAVRIYDWMVRTPKLSLLRGASDALSAHTSRERVVAALGVRWCDDAGDVDGVVAVELGLDEDAGRVADTIAAYLRAKLPAVEWEAWWATSDEGYLAAFLDREAAALAGLGDPDIGHRLYLPATMEPPIAETCHGCRRELVDADQAAATDEDGRHVHLGEDCHARQAAPRPKRRESSPALPPRARHFRQLAEQGGLPPGQSDRTVAARSRRNHLATIHADGNGIGAFMGALTQAAAIFGDQKPKLQQLRGEVVTLIDHCTEEAVDETILALGPGAEVSPAIKHFVGGDDILLSVPAPLAWDFVTLMMRAFEAKLKERVGAYAAALDRQITRGVEQLSLGVGITFAHQSQPFADCRRLAFDAMKKAKQYAGGAAGAVSWVDLTAEDRLADDRWVSLDTLERERREGQPVFDLPNSARAALSDILRDQWQAPHGSRDKALAEVHRWIERTGRRQSLGEPDDLVLLRDQLSRARWWSQARMTGATR